MKIIIDSTTDLPKELIEKYDIEVLPLRVLIDDKEYTDKETISVDQVYDAMKREFAQKPLCQILKRPMNYLESTHQRV